MARSDIQWPGSESPLERLQLPGFSGEWPKVWIKRDDLLEPYGGNKWRKLKYHVRAMRDMGCDRFVTFGGPFSNHIYAAAELCKHTGLDGTGCIRGAVDDTENPVLSHARKCGLKLVALSRREYAERYSTGFNNKTLTEFPGAYIIPEGGAGERGLRGCAEIVDEVALQLGTRPDLWVVAAGTGNTAVGIASRIEKGENVIAIAALRKHIMAGAVKQQLAFLSEENIQRLRFNYNYTFGSFAVKNDELLKFMLQAEKLNDIAFDPVYTAKALYGLNDLLEKGELQELNNIVFVHTGGMPGRLAFNYRYGTSLPISPYR